MAFRPETLARTGETRPLHLRRLDATHIVRRMKTTQRRIEATPRRKLNVTLFDTLASRQYGARTAEELAEELRIHRATYFRWRSGGPAPALDKAMAVADALGADVGDLWPPEAHR